MMESSHDDFFAEKYDKYYVRIYRFILLRVWHRQDAEDVAQHTWMEIYRSLSTFDRTRCFLSWAFSIARRRIERSFKERTRYQKLREQLIDNTARDDWGVDETALSTSDIRIEYLRECVGALPERDRKLYKLRVFDDMSWSDVGRRTSQSDNTAAKSFCRLKRRLLECMQRKMKE